MYASFHEEKMAGMRLFLLCQGHEVTHALQMLVKGVTMHIVCEIEDGNWDLTCV